MFQFTVSCIILICIALWWGEAKYNFLYEKIESMKKLCNWIKGQTKFKIDICKVFIFLALGGLICYSCYFLLDRLYLPYFDTVLDVNNEVISLKNNTAHKSKDDGSSPIGDWGTFGDFIGGTLNPIIGLISVILLFATWVVTYRNLEVSREELSESTKALKDNAETQKEIQKTQILQQFDSLFFDLLKNFQYINVFYLQHRQYDKYYKEIFIEKKNLALSQDVSLIQYFSSLKLILKTVDKKLNIIEDQSERKELQDYYIDVVLAQIPNGMFHILAWYGFKDKDLKMTLENSGFFRTIDFKYYIDNKNDLFGCYNFELLSNLHRYDEKIFHNSQEYLNLKKTYLYKIFFGDKPFIYNFFEKQYVKEVVLEVKANLTGKYKLKLTFDENGMNYSEYNEEKKVYIQHPIPYKNMKFNTYTITANWNNNFGFLMPEGDISKLEMSNSETYTLIDLKIN